GVDRSEGRVAPLRRRSGPAAVGMSEVRAEEWAARARELDAADDLGAFRERFVVDDPSLVYFDGNSLGRLPLATVDRVRQVLGSEWGADLITSWERSWIDLPMRVGDLIGTGLLGARAG